MKLTLSFQLNHPAYREQRTALKTLVTRACKAALAHEGIAQAELSVVLADDDAIRELNCDFRGKDKATNVLSFPSGEEGYLGDVMISLDTVVAEAQKQGKAFADHLAHLAVHACLHLLGHDHEEKGEAVDMEEKEIKILKTLGVENPYL